MKMQTKNFQEPVFVAVLVDETTDITKKRLGIYIRTVDEDMNTRTRFLTNIPLDSGTPKAVTGVILFKCCFLLNSVQLMGC